MAAKATGFSRQQGHGRELPAHTDRLGRSWQIGDMNDPTICARAGVRASNGACIDPDPDHVFWLLLVQQGLKPDLLQPGFIDLPVLQCLVNARKLPLEARRERQLHQRTSLGLTEQRIAQIEQSIDSSFKTGVNVLTKLFQSVKVQGVRFLCLVVLLAKDFTSFGSSWQSRAAFFPGFV